MILSWLLCKAYYVTPVKLILPPNYRLNGQFQQICFIIEGVIQM